MDKQTATQLIDNTFNFPFDEGRFRNFAINLLNNVDEAKRFDYISGTYIRHSFKNHITKYKRLGTYTDPNGKKIDILVVQLKNEWALERSRTMLRNFASDYLKNRDEKDAALVAYYTTNPDDWRFSYIRMEYKRVQTDSGKFKIKEDVTPAKRYSFLVGKNEPNHTAQAQLVGILSDDRKNPTLSELETAFSVDAVTKQFYKDYRAQFEKVWNELNKIVSENPKIKNEFETKSIDTANFAKKLMGQIVFLYFLQKKGWLGVGKDDKGNFKEWGTGPKNFLHELFNKKFTDYNNFFNDLLEPLFYEGLASEHDDDYFSKIDCKIPFLNGGLFEPINRYNWQETDICIDNDVIAEVFSTFDRYNFTVREDEPLEKEVAVDPEMLGKVFENLLPDNLRKGQGAYYTPRTIVHYMCQESLINYLDTACEPVPKQDIETLIREGDIILELETAITEGTKSDTSVLMDTIKENAQALDDALADIKVCDPAIGSGAFPVGMLTEIVRARKVLELYLSGKHTIYELKRHCIQNSLYGVDIDPGAIEIAKLRLWLSLVVDEDNYEKIQPLPNLDYKIMQGNSLIEEFHGISLDIEKKPDNKDESVLFGENSEIDKLIDELHERQQSFFNAVHHREKGRRKIAVEKIILKIFRNELRKQKQPYFTELRKIEDKADMLKIATDRATYLTEAKTQMKRRFNNFDVDQVEAELTEMTHGNKTRNFFPWKLYFADVFRGKGGFDIVIANPPYIGEKGHKELFREVKNGGSLGKFYQGKMDLFYFFYHLALNLGNNDSQVAFISTNYYPTASGAHNLRDDFKNRAIIKKLINFNELKIFKSATGQHNMVTILAKGQDSNAIVKTCITKRTGTANEKILNTIVTQKDKETDYFSLEQKSLYDGQENYIRFAGVGNINSPIGQLLEKVKKQGKNLGGKDGICNVNQGIVTGADKVSKKHIKNFKLDAQTGDGIFILKNSETKNLNLEQNEKQILKPWFKNSDAQKWNTQNQNNISVIYTNNETIKNIKDYPNLFNHLSKFKTIISRYAYRWFDLHRSRQQHIFEGAKIVAPQRSLQNTFGYNKIPWYASADVYFITKKDNLVSLKYLLAVLNSKLYYLWLYYRGKRKGEMLELYQQPLSEIPIKKVSEIDQKPFIEIVDKILEITKAGDYPENPDKQAKVKEYEKQIDRMVYKLYGLTEDEIAIVESKPS